MTTAADDAAVEDAFEAYLAGRPVAAEGAGVAAFAEAVRETATRPGRPNAALVELLTTGLLADQPSPSPRTARSRRRRRLAMFLPALIAKIVSAGAVAQAATGAGIAVVVVTSAGAAGVLPAPIQETFSSIVGTETADETADQTPETTDPAETDPADQTEPSEPSEPSEPTEGVEGPDPDQPFGQWVDGRVEHGEIDGRKVSEWAHERNQQRRDQREQTESAESPEAQPDDQSADEGADQSADEGADQSGDHGDRQGRGDKGHGDD